MCVRSVREIAVAALLALGDCEARRASDESVGARPMQLGSEESVFFDCCLGSSFAALIGTTLECLNMSDRRLM